MYDVRVKLSGPNYKPLVWSKVKKVFEKTESYDILRQDHFVNRKDEEGTIFSDYEMIIRTKVEPNEVVFVEIIQTEEPHVAKKTRTMENKVTLEGFTDQSEVIFSH